MRRGLSIWLKLVRISPPFHKEEWIPKFRQQTVRSDQGHSTVSATNPQEEFLIQEGRSRAQYLKILSYQIKIQIIPKLHSMCALHTSVSIQIKQMEKN